jgi:hypothetical protein
MSCLTIERNIAKTQMENIISQAHSCVILQVISKAQRGSKQCYQLGRCYSHHSMYTSTTPGTLRWLSTCTAHYASAVLITTCTCFRRTLQLHFHQIYTIFPFQACPAAVLQQKKNFASETESLVQKQHFLSGWNVCPHTHVSRNMETTPICRMVHCLLVRQTTEKFHSMSNPKRKLHT